MRRRPDFIFRQNRTASSGYSWVYTPLAQPVQVEEPELNAFERKGFTAVERGGKEILAE